MGAGLAKGERRLGKAPSSLFWSVWKARNAFVFINETLSIQKLKTFFVFSIWLEAKYRDIERSFDYS